MEEAESVKVCLLGDSNVGKSSLALRFVSNEFRAYSQSTIGASFTSKTVEIVDSDKNDSRQVSFNIWDTAGEEKYHSLASLYYRNAAAAIVVYDISNRATFRALQMWITEVQSNGPKEVVLVLCGNKLDLGDHRQVPRVEAIALAESVGATYIETSARDATNVDELFMEVGKRVLANEDGARVKGTGLDLHGMVDEPASSKCC